MTNNLKAERTLTAEELQAIIAEARDFCRHPNVHFHYTDGARVMSALADAVESLSTQQPMGEPVAWLSECIAGEYKGEFEVSRDKAGSDPFNKMWGPWFPVFRQPALHPNQESGE